MKVLNTTSSSSRKGKLALLAEADKNGLIAKIETFDPQIQKFAKNKEEYDEWKAADKIGKCYLTGRTCSNDYFVATVGKKKVFIGITVGRELIRILKQVKNDDSKLSGAIKAEEKKQANQS